MRTEGCIIGKYQGKEVYKVTLSEYVNRRYYKDKYYVFLIDGELIYNNEAFASYDGNYVSVYDSHKKRTFTVSGAYVIKRDMIRQTATLEPETSSTFGDLVDEILSDSFGRFSGMTDAVACAPALADAFLKTNLEF